MAAPISKSKIDLTRLPPGFHRRRIEARDVGFDLFIWRGEPGPVLLLNGATHGDEYEGPTLLHQWAAQWRPDRLTGTVVMVPVLNEAAFFAGQRCDPADGLNLARVFPGQARGSITTRLAYLFDTQLLAQCSHYVDLHSGGLACELLPWTGYLIRADGAGKIQRKMAACFDNFWCWAGPFLPGRTLSAAHARNIPAIYVECRGAGGGEPSDLQALDRGLHQLLHRLGCVPGAPPKLRRQKIRTTDDAEETHLQIHHPAPHDGLFVPSTHLGRRLKPGQEIGIVRGLNGRKVSVITATRSGRVVLLRYQRSVRCGNALCALAPI